MLCTVHIVPSLFVVCVGASADGTGALLKPPCAATCHCETSDHMTGGDPGERTSVTMVILIRASIDILEVGLIELDYYRFLNEGFKHRLELIKCREKHESQKF